MSHKSYDQILSERRELIKYTLSTFRKNGGRAILPPEDEENIYYDRINIKKLIEGIELGNFIDITKSTYETIGSSMTSQEFNDDYLLMQMPTLDIPQLRTSLEDYQLQEMAFLLYSVSCVDNDDMDDQQRDMFETIRRHLELSPGKADDINSLIQPYRTSLGPNGKLSEENIGLGIDLLLKLLVQVRPKDFKKFKDFVKWRDTMTTVIVHTMKESIGNGQVDENTTEEEITELMAKFKGAIRRMVFYNADDFHEVEYTSAAKHLEETVRTLAEVREENWLFSWGLRVKLWETLLKSTFDSDNHRYIDNRDMIIEHIMKHLAPKINISEYLHYACNTWVHFMQVVVTGDIAAMNETKELILHLKNDKVKKEKKMEKNLNDLSDETYTTEISRSAILWLEAALMDYHKYIPGGEKVKTYLELLLCFMEKMKTSPESKNEIIPKCIDASCTAVFKRAYKQLDKNDSDCVKLKKLAVKIEELFEIELLTYTKHLAEFCSSAAAMAARAFHNGYTQELMPVLTSITEITDEVVDMICTADKLENILYAQFDSVSYTFEFPSKWNVFSFAYPLLSNSVEKIIKQKEEWMERLVKKETWDPASGTTPVAVSAVEIKKMLDESIDVFYNINLPFPEDIEMTFLKGIKNIIKNYVSTIVDQLGGMDKAEEMLVPPVPTMTRFKETLAKKASKVDTTSTTSGRTSSGKAKKVKSFIKGPAVVKVVKRIGDCENFEWVNQFNLKNIIVRINTIFYLLENLETMKQTFDQMSISHLNDEGNPFVPIQCDVSDVSRYLTRACESCAHFLSCKIVFWDGREKWLEDLYKHQVSSKRIDTVYDDLYSTLTLISENTSKPITRDYIAKDLLMTTVESYKRVLLEGGPYRLFVPKDVTMLHEDYTRLKELFKGGGEGLSDEAVDAAFKEISEILLFMEMDTDLLIQKADENTKTGENINKLARILSHRAERAASKWLKAHLSVPKKIKSV